MTKKQSFLFKTKTYALKKGTEMSLVVEHHAR